MKNRKKIKRYKREKLKNKKLCKKYPWLVPSADYLTGRTLKKRTWNYSWTWWNDMPRGWDKCFGKMLLEELDAAIKKYNLTTQFGIDQLKEKWGRLEIYCHGYNDEIMHIIRKYSYISENVCISCGTIDVPMVNSGWVSPHCFNCFAINERWINKCYRNDRTDEEIRELYSNYTSDKEEDWKICDSYTVRRFSKNGDEIITYDISDTVAKIRGRYAKK